jgi:hypothetical protein
MPSCRACSRMSIRAVVFPQPGGPKIWVTVMFFS